MASARQPSLSEAAPARRQKPTRSDAWKPTLAVLRFQWLAVKANAEQRLAAVFLLAVIGGISLVSIASDPIQDLNDGVSTCGYLVVCIGLVAIPPAQSASFMRSRPIGRARFSQLHVALSSALALCVYLPVLGVFFAVHQEPLTSVTVQIDDYELLHQLEVTGKLPGFQRDQGAEAYAEWKSTGAEPRRAGEATISGLWSPHLFGVLVGFALSFLEIVRSAQQRTRRADSWSRRHVSWDPFSALLLVAFVVLFGFDFFPAAAAWVLLNPLPTFAVVAAIAIASLCRVGFRWQQGGA